MLNSPSVTEAQVPAFGTPADIAGLVIWIVGWLLETQADIAKVPWPSGVITQLTQLFTVPLENDKASEMAGHSKGKLEMVPPSSVLWRVRHIVLFQHPVLNRVFRIMCWWGIWALSISPSLSGSTSQSAQRAQYAALASPLFTMM